MARQEGDPIAVGLNFKRGYAEDITMRSSDRLCSRAGGSLQSELCFSVTLTSETCRLYVL